MSWIESTLGKLIEIDSGLIQTGPFGSQLHQSDYRDEGVPVVMPKDIVGGGISFDSIAYVSEDTAHRLSRHKLPAGSIVLPRRGDISKRAFIHPDQEGWLCGTGCLKIELAGNYLLPEYLYYYMGLPSSVRWLEQHAVGSTMLNLSAGIVGQFPLRLPSIEEQRGVVATLTAYSSLIENNRRRMALLEESARLLYQEWFIHLHFPGHEHVRITDGVPEGWEQIALEEALVLQRGFDLPTQDRRDGSVPIYGSTGIVGHHDEAKTRGPGIVTGRSGTLGQVHYVTEDFWPLNTALWVKEFKRVSPLFALFLLKALDLRQFNGGASVPTLDRKAAHRVTILLPLRQLITDFTDLASDIFEQINNLNLQNQKLRTTRDLLLPRLMSGEVTV